MRLLLKATDRGRTVFIGVLLLLILGFSSRAVLAHAKLLRSMPAANSTLSQAPAKVELWFSEELEARFNSIVVTDQNGRHVDRNNLSLGEGNKKLQIDLEELGPGTYTVEWGNLSADQHTMKGKFSFMIASGAAAPTKATPTPGAQMSPQSQAAPNQQRESTTVSTQESGSSWGLSVVRWLEYLAMMILFGGFAFHPLVLGQAIRRTHALDEEQRTTAFSMSARGVVKFLWLSLALLIIAALVELVLQTSTVLDKTISESLRPSLLRDVITNTGFGTAWRLQILATAALLVIVFLLTRRIKHAPARDHKGLWLIGLAAGALLLFSPTWTGHAAAAAKESPLAKASDWIHLMAAGLWVGILFHLALIMPRSLSTLEKRERLHVFHRVIPLFTRLAIPSTILIVLTGTYNSWLHVGSFSELWSTPYGETLLIKVLLVIPMLALGAVNTFIFHPRVSRLIENDDGTWQHAHSKLSDSFYRSVRIEAALGVVVLLVASVLVFLTPARHRPMTSTFKSGQRTIRKGV